MSRKIVKTSVGLSTVAAGMGATYAYFNPAILPNEARSFLEKYDLLKNEPRKVVEPPRYLGKPDDFLKTLKADIAKAEENITIPRTLKEPVEVVEIKKPLEALQSKQLEMDVERQVKAYEEKLVNAIHLTETHVKTASEAKYKTIDSIKEHAATLKKAVDDGQNGNWSLVNAALSESENFTKKDMLEESLARNKLDYLRRVIIEGKNSSNLSKLSLILIANETANKLNHQLDELNYLAEKARNERQIFNQYKDLIEKSRQHFAQELCSIVPGVDINAKNDNLTTDELNALIAHAYLRVDQLRRQLIEQQVQEERNIAKAIDDQRLVDSTMAQNQLDMEMRRVCQNTNIDVEKKVHEERQNWETELESRLLRASAAHVEHLESVVRAQKQIHDMENTKLVEEAVLKQRDLYGKEVETAITKLKGIETALDNRIAADMENRKYKQYWLACQNLIESITYGQKAGLNLNSRRKPLDKELEVIKKACANDDFVQSVVNCFPEEAVKKGVYTEQDLKNRFNKVFILSKRTAQIDENGGSLLKFISSYIQSLFMIQLPQSYLPTDKLDPSSVDPYELLCRAEYFVERGDLKTAIRLAHLLKGQPALVAQDWICDARTFLETRFLADLLLTHATVTSIRFVS